MQLTRVQRRRLFATCFALLWAVFTASMWLPAGHSFERRSPGGGGVAEHRYGPLAYLVIVETDVTVSGAAAGPDHAVRWQWRPLRVGQTLLATVAVGLVSWLGCRYMVRHYRLVGRCDGCGYDLTARAGPHCPECGEPVAPARR